MTIIRTALAVSAVMLVIFYVLSSDWPLAKFEFTVLQMLAILVVLKAIEK